MPSNLGFSHHVEDCDTQAGQMRVVEAGQMCVTACDVCEIHHEDGIKEIA